jgi:hypothetical protein
MELPLPFKSVVSILRLLFQVLIPVILLTGCATAPSVVDPRHDPSNPAAAESPAPKSPASLMDAASQANSEEQNTSETAPDTGMKNMSGMKGMEGMKDMPGMNAPTAPATTTANKTIYTCPMHPEVQQDHPGKCPKCGMTLVPKKAEAH